MMVVVPDTRWLVIAADPDHRVLARLPAELEPLEVALVVRKEVFAEELEGASLDGEQGVDLHDLIHDLRDWRRTIEGPDRLCTRHEQELVLQGIAACERRAQ